MKYILLILCLFISAAKSKGYRYIGIAGDIVVLKFDQERLFVKIGAYIPNTDFIIYGVDDRGAVTSGGVIKLQDADDYASETLESASLFNEGDCIFSKNNGKSYKITEALGYNYVIQDIKTMNLDTVPVLAVDKSSLWLLCPISEPSKELKK